MFEKTLRPDGTHLALAVACFACAVMLPLGIVAAADKPKSTTAGSDAPACSMESGRRADADSEEDSDEDDAGGVRRMIGGTCVNLSANSQATGQIGDVSQPRADLGPTSLETLTLNADVRLETARATRYGVFKTAFQTDWSYYSDTGFDKLPNLGEASISFLGFTAGFSESLMNFWSSNFQFTSAGPNLSSYLVNKEFSFSETTKLAVGVEAGPPSSRGAASWQFPTTAPYYTSRFRYEKDEWTLHASAAAHETDTSKTPLVPGSEKRQIGWATSLGANIPLTLFDEDDSASVQVTYAVNSRVFLGASTDRAALASIIPGAIAAPTTGWSALGSFEHNWNEKWSSNFFASRLVVDVDAVLASPSIVSTRVGANLIYQVTKNWQIGAEVSHVNARIDPDGTFGLLNGASFAGKTGFLWLRWEL
jgi:hypothetical protein